MPTSPGHPGIQPSLCFQPSFLPVCPLGGSTWRLKDLGPWHLHKRWEQSSLLLAFGGVNQRMEGISFKEEKKKSPRGHKIRMPTETCQTNDGGTNTASSVTSLPIWPQNLVIPWKHFLTTTRTSRIQVIHNAMPAQSFLSFLAKISTNRAYSSLRGLSHEIHLLKVTSQYLKWKKNSPRKNFMVCRIRHPLGQQSFSHQLFQTGPRFCLLYRSD